MGMLTNPKLMLPFQIARICKTISNVRCDLRGGVCLLWGAQAASLQGSAACRTQPQTRFRQAAGNDRLAACAPQM